MKHFTIIGGGVAGLTAAIGLQKIGIQATVYEGAPVLKGIGAGFGLAANAMKALEYLGLRTEVMALGHLLPDYNILDEKGQILVAPDTSSISQRYKQDNFAIHRADLHQYLLSKIEPSSLLLGYRAVQLQQHQEKIILTFDNGHTVETDYLLIADGVKSALRQQLIPSSAPRYSGYTCWRATIDNSTIQLGKGSETWGAKGRFGMTPLVGNKIYWYACINTKANNPVYRNWNIENLRQHFASYHHPIPQILNETENSQLIWNDIIDIKPLNQLAFGNILLMGDAGHATTPNMGQGACQAIEDVAVLIDELKKDKTIAQAFLDFEKRRLSRTRYITETSWTIGQVAQWQNPALIATRNFLMKILPENLQQYKLNKLLNVDFMEINNKR